MNTKISAASEPKCPELNLKDAENRVEAQFRFLADVIPQIVWTARPDGNVDYYNQRWFDYTGLTFEQTKDRGWERVMHPDDLPGCMERSAACAATGEPFERELRLRRACDGEYRWHLARSVAMRDADGKILCRVGTSTDIHDQKTTSAALKDAHDQLELRVRERTAELSRQQRFLHAVLDSITDGIIACDSTGKVSLLNRTLRELHGDADKPVMLDDLPREHKLHRADGSAPLQPEEVPLARAFRGEIVKDHEILVGMPDGLTRRRVRANGRAILDADGNRLGAVIAAQDITERAAAENKLRLAYSSLADANLALQQSEKRFSAFMDNSPAVCYIKDEQSRLVYVNKKFESLFNASADELVGTLGPCYLAKDVAPQTTANDQLVLRTGQPTEFVEMVPFPNGEKRSWLSLKFPLNSSDGRKFVGGVSFDITARIEAEAQIERQKQFIEAVLENLTDGVIACDTAGRITFCNTALLKTQGIDRLPEVALSEWAVENLALYDLTGRRLDWVERPLAKALRNSSVDGSELMLKPPNGLHRNIVVSARPMADKAGQIIGAVAAWHDVTDLRRSQKELLTAKEAADAANQAKSEFLANMSHEIRTPMTAILGYTDLLADPAQSPRQRAEYVQVIRRNGQHLLQLLSDILDLSKIEAGEMTLERLVSDPVEMLNEIESLMRPHAAGKNISLTMRHASPLPRSLVTDPTRLKQILLNLVGNAVKFTDTGGVNITAGLENTPGLESIPGSESTPGSENTTAGNRLRFDISDTGIGLTAGQQANLFHPFRQADGSTTRRFGGTGLGLAICKRLALMLEGELTVTSQAGVGSTFSLILPVELSTVPASATAAPVPVNASSAENIRMAGKILVAEDGIDNQRLARLYLEAAGLVVETAGNGRIAVSAIMEAEQTVKPFDAVLMDMQMPELDGYDATAELRQAGFTSLPIIAFTAHALASERESCIRSGCNDYVTKPIDRASLLQVLSRYLPTAETSSTTTLRSEKAEDPLICTILDDYINGLPEHISKISQLLSKADLRSLRLLVHQLKGSGGSYGFPEITTRARSAEAAITGKEPMDRIVNEVQSLVELVRRVDGYDRARETPNSPTGSSTGLAASAASGLENRAPSA